MSELKRYQITGRAHPVAHGEMVRYEDAARLEAENARLRALVAIAYNEGWHENNQDGVIGRSAPEDWNNSSSLELLEWVGETP